MQKAFGQKPFRLLDVGAGNHSPSKTTSLFPGCEYYGLDLNKDYNYNEADSRALKGFYEMDLTKLELDVIPDNFFDYINMAHIIEHLHNGDRVVEKLLTKLKSGGYIYIEYPGQRSTTLPSMRGTLNFYDDDTHVRVYSVKELSELLEKNGLSVISGGTRRNWFYILAAPARIAATLVRGKKLQGNIFWDMLGFAEYVFARKK